MFCVRPFSTVARMSIWGRIFAAGYDRVMARTERDGLSRRRAELLAQASGDVLEVGGGTGANLAHYGDGVTSLTVTEPAEPMFKRLADHVAERRPGTRLLHASAEDLPFPDQSFDTVVATLVLCTVDDPSRALAELRRVLRPGGRLLFIEHVRSEDPRLAKWQDRLRPVQMVVGHGCRPNRRTLEGIRDAGFEVTDVEHSSLEHAPPLVRPLVTGVGLRS